MVDRLPREAEAGLDAVLAMVTGKRNCAVAHRVLGTRPDYWVIETLDARIDPPLIVKLAGAMSDEPSFSEAAAAHRLATEHTALPLARVLAADDSFAALPFRYAVKTRIDGRNWFEAFKTFGTPERDEALQALGAAVAELHRPRFPGFGRFSGNGPDAGLLDALRERSGQRIRAARHRDLFAALLDNDRALFEHQTEPTICHDDLHGFNILLAPGRPLRLATILDFDKAWAGPAESDLARMELWTGMTGPPFWDAYLARHSLAQDYPKRRPFYQLLWCLEYAVNSSEHRATTAAVCAALGIDPVGDFSGSAGK